MGNPNPIREEPILPHPLDDEAQKWWEGLRSKRVLRTKNRGLTITEIYIKHLANRINSDNEASTRISAERE